MSTEARDVQSDFLKHVKQAVLEVEPSAEVYLYGSRARGEAHAESDWDFLILLEGPVTEQKKHAIWDNVYEVELEAGEAASLVFYQRSDWENARWTPFQDNVRREAVAV